MTRTAAFATWEKMPPFVSASAVVYAGENVLVVLDPIRREPILPGGHLMWRETPEDAARREVREETGIEVELEGLVAVVSGVQWAGEPGIVRVIYAAQPTGGQIRSSGEGAAQWMPASALAHSPTRDAALVQLWLDRGVSSIIPG